MLTTNKKNLHEIKKLYIYIYKEIPSTEKFRETKKPKLGA